MDRNSPDRRRARLRLALLALALLGWVSGGLHHAFVGHAVDPVTGGLAHVCAGAHPGPEAAAGDVDERRGLPAGPSWTAAPSRELHLCRIVFALDRASGPEPAARMAARTVLRVELPLRPIEVLCAGEPRFRLAPKGSPPVPRLQAA